MALEQFGNDRVRFVATMRSMDRTFITIGAASAFLAVSAGAFGAHALRARIPADLVQVWETGATYEMYHALALIAVGLILGRVAPPGAGWVSIAGWLFLLGTLLFSGSLYVLATTGVRWLGAITPFGGIAFLAGWIALIVGVWRA